jgi:uncharacterized membrane protein
MNASAFFTDEEKKRLKEAVVKAENNTSGEIRVHVETSHKGNVLDRAATVFADLNMHKTELRNGVLFYFAIKNRDFAILGDAGINKAVADNFWDKIKETMESYFIKSDFTGGLCTGVEMAGEALKINFPHSTTDENELPDEISFNK